MAKERDLRLGSCGISENRYRELKFFCRQYKEKKKLLRETTEISSQKYMQRRGKGGHADPTAAIALKRERLERELDIIEQTALEAGAELYPYLLKNVTEGTAFEFLEAPISRSGFYNMRRLFFSLLNERR